MKMQIKALFTMVLISFLSCMLIGCSGYVRPSQNAPTMADVYAAGVAGETGFEGGAMSSGVSTDTHARPGASLPLFSSTVSATQTKNPTNSVNGQTVLSTLNSQFPTLPNPQSLMYIFGHYTTLGHLPVPGHFVAFSLYSENYYALPLETMIPYNDGQFNE